MSLSAIVRNYQNKYRDRAYDELAWFHEQPDLCSAIENAAIARNRNGKRFLHQRRLTIKSLKKARQILLANIEAIEQVNNFDKLHSLINALLEPIPGIGELYIYDTSLRIGAKLNLLPERVYLHSGTRVGAKALGVSSKLKAIDTTELPREFQQLTPYEIEDVLCIFKSILKREPGNIMTKTLRC